MPPTNAAILDEDDGLAARVRGKPARLDGAVVALSVHCARGLPDLIVCL
jgi:hypothetical protein